MSIRAQINFNDGLTVPVMTKLFDSIVKLIVIYGCKIRGLYGWKKNHFKSIENDLLSKQHKFETVHIKFRKQTVGINKKNTRYFDKS